MKHQFRKRLLLGDLLIGTMVSLASPDVVEVLVEAGFDWLFIDAEHGTFDAREIQTVLQSAGAEMPCIVRLAAGEEVPIKKALDVGAAGVIAPQVNSAEQAQRIVQYAKYPPDGVRGVGISRAHRFGLKFQEYVDIANNEIAVIVQAEHIEAVENIDSIVRVPGIDAVLVGPYDLSASVGRIGNVNHPDVIAAIDHVTETCLDARIRLGIFGTSAGAVRPYIKKGYTLIIAGVDTILLGQAARSIISELIIHNPKSKI